MDRIWQWAWDRYSARYSWAVYFVGIPLMLPIYLFLSLLIVAVQGTGQYVEAAAITVVSVPVLW
jgi:adenylate cyclase